MLDPADALALLVVALLLLSALLGLWWSAGWRYTLGLVIFVVVLTAAQMLEVWMAA